MSKTNLLIIYILIFFKLSLISNIEYENAWVIWDIGQGQWVTHFLSDECIHFDIGGELGTYSKIQKQLRKVCSGKKNILFLSHWDFDHFFNLTYLAKDFSNLCWASRPEVTKLNFSVQKILDLAIQPCSAQWKLTSVIKNWYPPNGRTSNDLSIVSLEDSFLMPGDSPLIQEKKWDLALPLTSVEFLVLGHHGSRTSTGDHLLHHLPRLKLAIASARFRKYGHPHAETLLRLQKNKTPVIKTEDWGSIWIF